MKAKSADFGKKLLAILVLAIAAFFILKFIVNLVLGIAWLIVLVVAVVAVIWAWRTL